MKYGMKPAVCGSVALVAASTLVGATKGAAALTAEAADRGLSRMTVLFPRGTADAQGVSVPDKLDFVWLRLR